LLEESLALARSNEDQAGVAYAIYRLGLVTREPGDLARSAALDRECLARYQVLGDRRRATLALLGLSDIARGQGDAAQPETYCTETLAISRERGGAGLVSRAQHPRRPGRTAEHTGADC
jgi:hypothetical protein